MHHSVYYYHKQNRENSYKKANEEIDKKIKEEYEKSKKRYGSPKITKVLNKQGIKVSQKRVARRMRALGLRSIIVKKFNHSGNKKVDDKRLTLQCFYMGFLNPANEKYISFTSNITNFMLQYINMLELSEKSVYQYNYESK